jgi:hypothetical protein
MHGVLISPKTYNHKVWIVDSNVFSTVFLITVVIALWKGLKKNYYRLFRICDLPPQE